LRIRGGEGTISPGGLVTQTGEKLLGTLNGVRGVSHQRQHKTTLRRCKDQGTRKQEKILEQNRGLKKALLGY